jgi:hypothetical protein
MPQGFNQFRQFLKEYGSLLAIGAPVAATPLAVGFAAMSPPWPSNISFVTSVIQLLVLILVFHFFGHSRRRIINRIILGNFITLLLISLGYVYLLRNFSYDAVVDAKGTIERRVKGFVCKDIPQKSYPDSCPFLGPVELNQVGNRPEELWTQGSRDAVHLALVSTWLLSFISLTMFIGSFLVYQRRVKTRDAALATSQKPRKRIAKKVAHNATQDQTTIT